MLRSTYLTKEKLKVMKILYIDYLSYSGHKNFNKIHLNALKSLGIDLSFVGSIDQYDDDLRCEFLKIPNFFYLKLPFYSISSRILEFLCLLYIRFFIKTRNFDFIIFPTYDIFSIFAFPTRKKCFLINHNNVGQLDNPIKLIITKFLPINYVHVALNNEMHDRLSILLPSKRVLFVPHGLCLPFTKLKRPSTVPNECKFFFCPVNRNYDRNALEELFNDDQVVSFLDRNNIFIIIKEGLISLYNKRIITVENKISFPEYNFLIKQSTAVILPYDDNFKYRCSGILFECIANDVSVVSSDINAMREFEDTISIRYFNNRDSFLKSLQCYLLSSENPSINKKKFSPYTYWQNVLI